jgi:hypothetical protein
MAEPRDNLEADFKVPDPLADTLRRSYRWPDRAPSALDDAVLAIAQERAGQIRTRRARARFLGRAAAVAAAAGLALAAVIIPRWGHQRGTSPVALSAPASGIAGDVNRDGAVDILDALVLARHLDADAAGRPAIPNADLNTDGAVDLRDVDAIAQAAVRLEGRG